MSIEFLHRVSVVQSVVRDGGWVGKAIVRREHRNDTARPTTPTLVVTTKEAFFEGDSRDVVLKAATEWAEEQSL